MSEEGELSPIQKLSNELKELRMQGKFMGDEFDKMDDKIGAYENAITSLIEKIVKGEGDTEKLRRQLNQLSITYENLSKIDESISSLAEVQTGMNNIQKETVETDRLMKNAFRGMQTSLETALEDSKNIFRAFSDFFGDFIQGLIIKMASAIAATLLLTLLLPAPTTAHGVSMGQFGKLSKAADIIGSKDIFNMIFGSGIPEMHNGGVSPKDEYLAVLEKGETVIPPDKLDQNKLTTGMGGKVVFRQHYDELIGVLETGKEKEGAF